MQNARCGTQEDFRRCVATTGLVAVVALLAVIALDAPRLRAQAPAPAADSPTFEVASVKPNKSGNGLAMIEAPPGGRYTATGVTVRMLILNAYRVQGFQIVGGPSWLNSDRFDIVAKGDMGVPDPVAAQQGLPSRQQLMIRALLAERFKLAVHNETRELPIYALVVAKTDGKLGQQLRKASVDCAALAAARGRRGNPPPPPPPGVPGPGERPTCGSRAGPANIQGGGLTMARLAGILSAMTNRVVVDRTGLAGGYDVDLQWTPEQIPDFGPNGPPPGLPPIDPNGPSIFTAVQELGLKLDPQKGPVDVLVLDRVERPTED